jgi:SAM-dependent methyltransferase
MSTTDKVFDGSIPKIYDELFVPMIFADFAEDLAGRVAAARPGAVLETAAGTGVVTRALAPRLRPDARYTVTDLNQPMLDLAAGRQGKDARITWQQADALALPFEDHGFDAVCCQFGAMFFPDRVQGYREARRVLRLGAVFHFNVWDRIEENVFADDVTRSLAELMPDDPPQFMARTPHGYHDEGVIRADLAAAGFADVAIERRTSQSRAPSPHHAAKAYCQGTPLRHVLEARGPEWLQAATDHVAAAIEKRHGSGEISAKIQALVIAARG